MVNLGDRLLEIPNGFLITKVCASISVYILRFMLSKYTTQYCVYLVIISVVGTYINEVPIPGALNVTLKNLSYIHKLLNASSRTLSTLLSCSSMSQRPLVSYISV